MATSRGEAASEDAEVVREARLSLVRNAVNQNKIKLWTEPYHTGDSAADQAKLIELGSNLAPTLDLDEDIVTECLRVLQRNALEKLEAREALAKTNMLSLKLKLSKGLALKGVPADKARNFTVNIDTYSTPEELAVEIASKLTVLKDKPSEEGSESDCDPESLRLIANGKTISSGGSEGTSSSSKNLYQLGIKPGSVVMALLIDTADESLAIANEQRRILNTAKADARMFADDDGRLALQDQTGKEVDLPKAEKDALVMAMSLHQKGRAAMKKGKFELGLVLLLEATEEFDNCRAEILNVIDNYALLDLDVAWCYLRLGNVSELPNAVQRLANCESKFVSSYGANLERVKAVKGHTGQEAVLLVRMHLLQAVVAYHSGQLTAAKRLLSSTRNELNKYRVDEFSVREVVANGFTEKEARQALRAIWPSQHVPDAVRHAQNTRQEREKVEKQEATRKKKRTKFGKTLSGNWVNLGLLETMTRMGFGEDMAAEALRQTENDVNAATEALNERPELILSAVQDRDFDPTQITKDMVSQVAAMGFDIEDAKKALVHAKGVLGDAVDALASGKRLSPVPKRHKKELDPEEEKRKEEAYERLQEDIDEAEPEDYLDLTLDEEKLYLEKYTNLMGL